MMKLLSRSIFAAAALLLAGGSAFATENVTLKSVPGVRGNAVSIDGAKVCLADLAGKPFDFKEGFTLSVWLKLDKIAHSTEIIGNAGSFFLLKRAPSCNDGFYFWDKGGKLSTVLWAPNAFRYTPGKWFHLAVTYDQKGTSYGYLNGKRVAVQRPGDLKEQQAFRIQDKPSSAKQHFRVAKESFNGAIDELYIYGRVLSDAEIAGLYAGKAPEGAQRAYLMDDPANPGVDSSAFKRNLTAVAGRHGTTVPLLGSVIDAPAAAANKDLTAWCRSSVDRVFQKDRLKSVKVKETIVTEMAGNEYESFQFVLTPNKELKKVNVKISDFQLGKNRFPAEIRMVEYVKIPQPSNIRTPKGGANVYGEMVSVYPGPEAKPGWYPDPLRKLEADLTLKANESKAFWITVKTPSGIPAGIYRASALVTAANGVKLEVPLALKVRNFSLPAKKHFTHTCAPNQAMTYRNVDRLYQIFAEYYLSPSNSQNRINVTFDKNGKMTMDTAAWDKEMEIAVNKYHQAVLFLPTIGMYGIPKGNNPAGLWCGIQIADGKGNLMPEFKEKFPVFLKAVCAHLKAKGWFEITRTVLVDEPHTPADFKLSRNVSELYRKYAPGLKIMFTKWPTKEGIGLADIWCLGAFQVGQMQKALARGEKIEQYPNWHFLIDRPVMDRRILGFQMWKYHVSGVLHYALDSGWGDPEGLISPEFRYPNGRILYGSGIDMYPERDGAPMPSMRLANTRDALEDYEYCCVLEELIAKSPDAPAAKEAMSFMKNAAHKLVPCYESTGDGLNASWKELQWEQDPHVLLKYRQGVMERIEKLNK